MTFRASCCGHVRLTPALSLSEFCYLAAFSESRRHSGRDHPYDVPGHPHDDGPNRDNIDRYNEPITGQPGLWCPWIPSCDGECLTIDDGEKIEAPVEWLQYLFDHFLRRGAAAESSLVGEFEGFTFDHELSGAVAMHRSDDGELSLITIDESRVVGVIVCEGESGRLGSVALVGSR